MDHSSSTLDTQQKKTFKESPPPPSCTFWHITFRQTVFTPTNWSLLVRHTSINDGKQKRKKNDSATPHTFGCRLLTEIHLRPSVLATEHHDRIAEPSSCCP